MAWSIFSWIGCQVTLGVSRAWNAAQQALGADSPVSSLKFIVAWASRLSAALGNKSVIQSLTPIELWPRTSMRRRLSIKNFTLAVLFIASLNLVWQFYRMRKEAVELHEMASVA
jgi:hypothetical protein